MQLKSQETLEVQLKESRTKTEEQRHELMKLKEKITRRTERAKAKVDELLKELEESQQEQDKLKEELMEMKKVEE